MAHAQPRPDVQMGAGRGGAGVGVQWSSVRPASVSTRVVMLIAAVLDVQALTVDDPYSMCDFL